MNDILFTPIRLKELEALIQNSIEKALSQKVRKEDPSAKNEELLTVPEAAKFLSLSVPTIYGLIHKREIPCMKPKGGKRVYFTKKDLLEYIKSSRRPTIEEGGEGIGLYLANKKRSI